MNTFKMRNVILIPMIVLAVNACAKRDSNLVKPSQAPVAGEKPADTTVTTGAGTAAEEAAKKALEMADGSLSYSPACKNPIKMDLSEKQDSLAITDLISESNKGTYNLVGTEYFAEADAATEGDPKEQISAFGNEYQTPENMSAAVSDNQKVTITCHTTKPAEGKVSKISGSMDFANSFSAADGKGTVVRQDAVTAKNGTIKTVTTLYSSTTDLKQSLASASDVKIVIVKQASGDVTIKKQFTRPDLKTGKNIKVTLSATYKLSTEVKAVETEAPKAATEETKAEEAR